MTNDTMLFRRTDLSRFFAANPEVAKRIEVLEFDQIGFDALIDGAQERFDFPFNSGAFEEIVGNLDTYEFKKAPNGELREMFVVRGRVRYLVEFTPEYMATGRGYKDELEHGDTVIGATIDEIRIFNAPDKEVVLHRAFVRQVESTIVELLNASNAA